MEFNYCQKPALNNQARARDTNVQMKCRSLLRVHPCVYDNRNIDQTVSVESDTIKTTVYSIPASEVSKVHLANGRVLSSCTCVGHLDKVITYWESK